MDRTSHPVHAGIAWDGWSAPAADGAPGHGWAGSWPAEDSAAWTWRSTSPAPELSVIITGWNAASTVERAIASVLEEHDFRLECIVVDDGSTDATAQVVRAIADRDPRVILVPLAINGGVSNARNQALARARGDWLAFLDADDRLFPGGIAALMEPTADPDVLAVVGQRVWTDGERTWLTAAYDVPDIREPGRKSIAEHPGLLYYASLTGKVFHRSLTDGLVFEGRVLGDQPWTIRSLLRAEHHIETIAATVYEWTRPAQGSEAQTLTSAKLRSAAAAIEMVEVAGRAYREVASEIDVRFGLDPTAAALKRAYLDRLIRSDLSSGLRSAIDRRDPESGALFEAVAEFLGVVPPDILAASESLLERILRPPAGRWRALPSDARSAYLQMVRVALRADPQLPRRRGALPMLPAFAVAGRFDGVVADAVASAALTTASLGASVARGLRGVVPARGQASAMTASSRRT